MKNTRNEKKIRPLRGVNKNLHSNDDSRNMKSPNLSSRNVKLGTSEKPLVPAKKSSNKNTQNQKLQGETNSRKRTIPPKKQLRKFSKAPSDEVLGVLLDQKTGNIFYVSRIDNFRYNGIDYAIMYNYQAGQKTGSKPEIVIMRTYRDGEKQYFTSIRNKTELNTIFEIFYSRFEQSL
ncbi:MAG: DUF1292 domain-containing protein [Clostridiaceae bacterium]|nr:DUF1292 domain-containing protein [Clostridiaceae bacterium]